jgi:hypothetical protein
MNNVESMRYLLDGVDDEETSIDEPLMSSLSLVSSLGSTLPVTGPFPSSLTRASTRAHCQFRSRRHPNDCLHRTV